MGSLEPNRIYSKKQTNKPHEPSGEFFKVKCIYGIDADKHHTQKPVLFFQSMSPLFSAAEYKCFIFSSAILAQLF